MLPKSFHVCVSWMVSPRHLYSRQPSTGCVVSSSGGCPAAAAAWGTDLRMSSSLVTTGARAAGETGHKQAFQRVLRPPRKQAAAGDSRSGEVLGCTRVGDVTSTSSSCPSPGTAGAWPERRGPLKCLLHNMSNQSPQVRSQLSRCHRFSHALVGANSHLEASTADASYCGDHHHQCQGGAERPPAENRNAQRLSVRRSRSSESSTQEAMMAHHDA